MKSLGPAFPCYHDDLLGGTQHMDIAQFGAYWLLLIHQWKYGAVPNDGSTLARLTRMTTSEWRKNSRVVLAKFKKTPSGEYQNAKMTQIRDERIAYIEKQRLAGRKSAEARFNGGSTVVQPEGEPNTQPKGNSPSPSPSPSPVPLATPTKKDAPSACDVEFETLWAAYPSKTGRQKALDSWKKWRGHGDSASDALAGIERYKKYVERRHANGFKELNYQNGATFFHQRGWMSEWSIEESKPTMPIYRPGSNI